MQRIATAALALLAAAPAIAQTPIDSIRPDAPELAPYGDHAVGVRTLTLTREGVPDIVNATPEAQPSYDRALTVELWYPAADGTRPGTDYETVLRDGETEVTLTGRAARDADPAAEGSYPLVIVSHGYPGNRFLMSHLAENIASKGYVVASIDHRDSTYSDMAAFGSTLVNRPRDQAFVLDELASATDDVGQITDAERTGVIGYSMGGYGALIFAGAGVAQAALEGRYAPPAGLLEINAAGSESHEALPDERVKAVIAIGPWGRNRDFWDAEGLGAITTPLMLVAGSVDDVSEYPFIRTIFEETTGTERHLLTFENANHNAAAPFPAPREAWAQSEKLGWPPFEHYADAVWDTVRMNNILQHFSTAFLDLHLKGEEDKKTFLSLTPNAADGVWAMEEDDTPKPEHTYWAGFANRTAAGLRFETRRAE
ncbi:alpha/beta hydrolase family protein [Profundibacterium mesophilum]|uniref:1-alkyl-2-acetylglycerophosphocholine esterase n=1 Tax=Profundibacterium mesophilum KAUST100406-0324 TaxID=1037889 RepID=A0A921NPJ5_9RHOB|nr:alpha/beta fold hydrolase [Profundibacterium mesophilum]KAF0675487.1 1-alkyl-2-acetylglycerophosphocholine esterase [Profundibacterium mesophilum KAUST100406-0324]